MSNHSADPQAPVIDEELDNMILGLQRDGIYPKLLASMIELRELRKARGELVVPVNS